MRTTLSPYWVFLLILAVAPLARADAPPAATKPTPAGTRPPRATAKPATLAAASAASTATNNATAAATNKATAPTNKATAPTSSASSATPASNAASASSPTAATAATTATTAATRWSYPDIALPPPPPFPYANPFQLRGLAPRTGVRLDTTVAPYEINGAHSLATVMFLAAHIKVQQGVAFQARWGFDTNRVGNTPARAGFLNPSIATLFGVPISRHLRFGGSVTASFPLGTGGGNHPDPADTALQRAGLLARSAMDNAAFVVNDMGFPIGASLAFVDSGFTAQVDATVIPSMRLRGAEAQKDKRKVNSTYGLFLGYFVIPEMSLGAEIHYQRLLTTTASVERDASQRDNLVIAGGVRFAINLGRGLSARPSLSYGHPLRGAVQQQSYRMVQIDLPFAF